MTSKPARSRAESTASLRARILEAAFQQFRAGGVEEISMRAVAGKVGLSPMGLYRHFTSRDALISTLVDRELATFEEYLRNIGQSGTPLARLRRLIRGYLDFALEHRASFSLLFLATRQSEEPFLQEYKAGTSPSFEIFRQSVHDAIESGDLSPRDSVDTALIIWAQAHGHVALFLAGRYGGEAPLFRKFYTRSLEILLDGLARG